MEPITGSGALESGPASIGGANPPYTYLGIANAMLAGVRVLAAANPLPALPLALVAAHVLECALKAYLSRTGDDTAVRKPDVRHDLTALWEMAFKDGLPITQSCPTWVTLLSEIHGPPYFLRYSTGVHGIQSPGPEPMTSELASLVRLVGQQLKR